MNKLFKALLLLLVVFAMPMKHWGQTPYRQYSDEGVVLNFHTINNVYFRSFLLYSISNDDRFVLIPEETYGQFIITSKDDDSHFMDEFESFYADVETDFSQLSKIDITNLMSVWKSSVESKDYLSIMMDVNTANLRADNDHCLNSMPFCTSEVIEFEAAYQGGVSGEPGPEYGCLSSQPYPSWYHMRIHTAGQFIIHMEAHDSYGGGGDIDYCIWGPFSDPHEPCVSDLTCDKLVDCSYSTASVEDVYLGYPISQHHHSNLADGDCVNSNNNPPHVPEVGEYYILMITNFAQIHQTISFTKAPNSGPGETDCDILPGIVNNDGPYCEGETIHLTVNDQPNATYSWRGPNGWTSDLQNPTRPNCTMDMAGTYTCTTTVGAQHTSASTEVQIFQQAAPSFTANTVCQGEPTQFNGIAGEGLVFHWDFDDGHDEIGQNVSHTYTEAGTYQVTLTVSNEDGSCPGETTQTVVVDAMPNAGEDETVPIDYGGSAQLNGPGSGSNFIYHWEPEEMVANADAQNTQTVALTQSLVYTLTITNPEHPECTDSKQVTVVVEGGALYADIVADPDTICKGETTQITVIAHAGTHDYTYLWNKDGEDDPSLNTPTISVGPSRDTEYKCKVSDGQTEFWTSRKKIIVNQPDTLDVVLVTGSCNSVHISWQGQDTVFYKNTTYTFIGETEQGCYREQTYHIQGMLYTPQPEIISGNPDIENPHYPITATEFNVNRYLYQVADSVSDISSWLNSQCSWNISKKSWRIDPSDDNLSCTVYAMDWVEDTVWLTFRAVSPCTDNDGIVARYWLKPSFFGIDETETTPSRVEIIPNPNNGQMEFRLEGLEGHVDVKVFNTVGIPIDRFGLQAQQGQNAYSYTMKPLSNGVYFFVFTNGKRSITKKVVIIH
ncbi:MAG: PKD domain-containing protein [Bacteroidales bacterium]|nr:PKD domain-containing protein [Bacteroidales bacterium]MBR0540316.1 PKD domain-containing protein [Bacteroidales bacterium]